MTLRTKSKARQWAAWLCVALVLLAAYVVLANVLYGAVEWNIADARCHRLLVPLVVLFLYIAKETRWDGIVREKKVPPREKRAASETAAPNDRVEDLPRQKAVATEEPQRADVFAAREEVPRPQERGVPVATPLPLMRAAEVSPDEGATGEELFAKARTMTHQVIPDFDSDGPYLEMLWASAAKGYAPAMTKLGEYAMRRAAWVEAYYWMSLAKRQGMQNLASVMREIRMNWSLAGFPDEQENVNRLFTVEAGSLGRALLNIASGHEAASARGYLRANHPEFLG